MTAVHICLCSDDEVELDDIASPSFPNGHTNSAGASNTFEAAVSCLSFRNSESARLTYINRTEPAGDTEIFVALTLRNVFRELVFAAAHHEES
jgi:hypothetical protein